MGINCYYIISWRPILFVRLNYQWRRWWYSSSCYWIRCFCCCCCRWEINCFCCCWIRCFCFCCCCCRWEIDCFCCCWIRCFCYCFCWWRIRWCCCYFCHCFRRRFYCCCCWCFRWFLFLFNFSYKDHQNKKIFLSFIFSIITHMPWSNPFLYSAGLELRENRKAHPHNWVVVVYSESINMML